MTVGVARNAVTPRNRTIHVIDFEKYILAIHAGSLAGIVRIAVAVQIDGQQIRKIEIDRSVTVGVDAELFPVVPQSVAVSVRTGSDHRDQIVEIHVAPVFQSFPPELENLSRKLGGSNRRGLQVVEAVRVRAGITRPYVFAVWIGIFLRAHVEAEHGAGSERLNAWSSGIRVKVNAATVL